MLADDFDRRYFDAAKSRLDDLAWAVSHDDREATCAVADDLTRRIVKVHVTAADVGASAMDAARWS